MNKISLKEEDKSNSPLGLGWGRWIRTIECRNQNPVPYHLAIPHHYILIAQLVTL